MTCAHLIQNKTNLWKNFFENDCGIFLQNKVHFLGSLEIYALKTNEQLSAYIFLIQT